MRFGSAGRSAVAAAAVVGSLAVAGVVTFIASASDPAPSKPLPDTNVVVSPANGTQEATLGSRIEVKADGGRLTAVEAQDSEGHKVAGQLAEGGGSWTAQTKVKPQTTYTVRAVAKSDQGKESSSASTFTTQRPEKVNKVTISPSNGQTVGTGMPISILFDNPVDEDKRAEIEKALKVNAKPQAVGAWGWVKDYSGKDRLDYRTRTYWPSGTHVSVKGALAGIDSGKGGWFIRDYDFSFTVGTDRKAVIDVLAHTLTMFEYGKSVGTVKGSAGSLKYPTRGGVHTVRGKSAAEVMDSSTIGFGDEWKLPSQWVTYLTASGTFLHSAPWNNTIGQENSSHGCFGMTTEDAKTVYDFLPIGATVEVKGTSSTEKTDVGNGLEVWQETWDQWQQRSALK
ncbi:Ig-like domain-containing protein [Streptomyces klenkii]|uniref:L,D-transpeptidase n=1 Tax=Streptomyces klenkii TaxID=1420899 RepID=UPI0033BD3A7F